jgi:hypothetical protein
MTAIDLTRLLSNLSTTADALNKETESINALISEVERTIRGMNLGVEAWAEPVRSEPAEFEESGWDSTRNGGKGGQVITKVPGYRDMLVGFAKGEKEWELRVRYVNRKRRSENQEEQTSIVKEIRLLDAPRFDRIEAFAAFPALIETMRQKAEETIRAIQAGKRLLATEGLNLK